MNETVCNDFQAISKLVAMLNQKINDSNETLLKLHETVKSLVPQEVYEQFIESRSAGLGSAKMELAKMELATSTSSLGNEDEILRNLQREQLQLIMELQKQDFITEKLENLILQNQEVLETIKEFLISHDKSQQEELQEARYRLKSYIENSIQPTLEHLKS
ncbi:hypothetical protein KGF56_001622 [Candida oxycetoniae]|uniref:Uncharacterized protein n=1 Tax=Candida oxycetoniae TaxID=497107 RepID=A0AAI9WZ21_9ASCO|nr:uncharacterized protein KGF56_001622 [Candida oxycetoniae]KAI3405604.2 hypothetical protein KGF56_001622 [Candida oxycetoniae]